MLQVTPTVPNGFSNPPHVEHAQILFGEAPSGAPDPETGIKILTETLGEIAHMRQIHGDRVAYADGGGLYEEYDALVTDQPNLWLCVKTADCVPILLSCPQAVAAVHCGWRGLAQEILPLTVDILCHEFQADPSEIQAFIGPHISTQNYPVGQELVETFPTDYFRKTEDGAWLMDLAALTQDQLKEMDVLSDNIWHADQCTLANQTLNSHRRSKANGNPTDTARNLSLISLQR